MFRATFTLGKSYCAYQS